MKKFPKNNETEFTGSTLNKRGKNWQLADMVRQKRQGAPSSRGALDTAVKPGIDPTEATNRTSNNSGIVSP